MKNLYDKFNNWISTSDSPMGRFRLKEALIVGVVLLLFAFIFNKTLFLGWVAQSIVQFSKAGFAAFAFYWGIQRRVLHARTHELPEKEQYKRENTLALCYAIIIACALSI